MKMLNSEIYEWGENIISFFNKNKSLDKYIPILINFYMQKNFKEVLKYYYEIIESKDTIIKYYGQEQEKSQYYIPPENTKTVMEEINKLMSIEQEINIKEIPLSLFSQDNLSFSIGEMECLLPMIKDDMKEIDIFSFLSNCKGEEKHFQINFEESK